jgi:hypothetical protein
MPRLESSHGPVTNFFWGPDCLYLHQQPEPAIELDQRCRAPIIGLQPHLDRFRPIVLALKQTSVTPITAPFDLRRPLRHVIYRLALFTSPPPAQPRHDRTHGQFVVHHRGQGESLAVHQLLQRLSLAQCAWKPVEDEPSPAVKALPALAHHLPDREIWHQGPTPHISQGFLHRGTLLAVRPAPRRPKNVPRRQVAGVRSTVQQLSLGAFPDPWRPQQHKPPRMMPLSRFHIALKRRSLQPRRAIPLLLCAHPTGYMASPPTRQ